MLSIMHKVTSQTPKLKIEREQILRLFPEKKNKQKNQQDVYKFSLRLLLLKRIQNFFRSFPGVVVATRQKYKYRLLIAQ